MRVRWLLSILLLCVSAAAQDMRGRLKGLVFEAEEWSTPKDAWVKDQHPADKWCLWTTEEDVFNKRSGGQSLQSPTIREDRATPEDGAPPLHTHITGIPNGVYQVWMNNPCRNIALSFDGRTWTKQCPSGETDLGIRRISDGTFDLWVDDRYAMPGQIGTCYYDYVRFEAVRPPKFSCITAFTLPDGTTQISWVTDVPAPTGAIVYGTDGNPSQRVSSEKKGMRNHAVVLPGLEQARRYAAEVRIGADGNDVFISPRIEFVAGERPTPPKSKAQRVALSVAEPTAFPRTSWPVTSGVPFAQGDLAAPGDVRLLNAHGQEVSAQLETLSRWPDGSVRWLLVDFQANTQADRPSEYVIDVAPDRKPTDVAAPIVREEGGELVMDTGAMSLRINKERFALFDRMALDMNGDRKFAPEEIVTGEPMMGNGRIVDATGKGFGLAKPDTVVIETNGPLRATVRVEGDFIAQDGAKLFRYRARLSAYANSPLLRLQWTIGNNNIKDVLTSLTGATLRLPIRQGGEVSGCLSDGKAVPVASNDDLWVLQDYDNHFARSSQGTRTEGERDIGLAGVACGGVAISAMVRDFWQTYPKGIAVKPDGLHLRLLPELPPDQFTAPKDLEDIPQVALYYCYKKGKYQVKRGLEYTADLLVRLDRALPPAAETAAHFQQMLFACATPAHYCATSAFWPLDPRRPNEFPEYAKTFDQSFENLEKGRKQIREYGWMNYGDWWGERQWNWGNSEYDLQYVMATHFAQTGNLDLFWRGDQMARHNTSIDVCHYPWREPMRELTYEHSVGHVGGFFERGDPRITGVAGEMNWAIDGAMDGSGGHTFAGGNFLYGFLTGDRRYLDVAEKVCWNQATTYTPRWGIPIERAAGWSLYNAMSAYESTLNPYYLNAAKIYLEKVFELQDPETGGWRLAQDSSECNCGVKHIGGKAFAAGVLLHGLIMYDRVCPDDQVKRSIVRAADWLLDYSWNEEKGGFRYRTGCPKYKDHGWYATLVTEGIAYAYEITKNNKYKDFLIRTLPGVVNGPTGSGRGSGKSFTQYFRVLPHTLYYVKRWGVTSLPLPPPPPKIRRRSRVFLDEKGQGVARVAVFNAGKAPLACELSAARVPEGCSLAPQTVKWEAPPGTGMSPGLTVTVGGAAPAESLKLVCTAGEKVRRELEIALVPAPKPTAIGDKTGFVGPEDHYSAKALREMGAQIEAIADLSKADLSRYRTIVVGSDVLDAPNLRFAEAVAALAGFVKGGGRLVFLQINDEHWQTDFLPFDLEVQDANGQLGEVVDTSHPLVRGVPSLKGTVCYDTIAYAGPEWSVVAKDAEGRPCIVSARYGAGDLLVVQASFDRWASAERPPVGVPDEICRQVMKNLAQYVFSVRGRE